MVREEEAKEGRTTQGRAKRSIKTAQSRQKQSVHPGTSHVWQKSRFNLCTLLSSVECQLIHIERRQHGQGQEDQECAQALRGASQG